MATALDNPLSDHPMVSKDQREKVHNCVVAEFHHTLSMHEDDHGKVMDDKEFYEEEADWLAGKSLEPTKPASMSNRTARTSSATTLFSSSSDAGCDDMQTETAPPQVAVRNLSVPTLQKKHRDLRTKMARKQQRDPFTADHEGLLSQVMALM